MMNESPKYISFIEEFSIKIKIDASIKSISIRKVLYSYSGKYREGKLKRVRKGSEKDLEAYHQKIVSPQK